jgi:glycosyltransferase involved in cell wall biosynthesis
MLKDIFPQNAVDLKMLSKRGIKGIIYLYFRLMEKKLYSVSNKIGCLSQANVDYIASNNKDINPDKLLVFPNSVFVRDKEFNKKDSIREKYNIPENKCIFLYGGNLGKPQGIKYFVSAIKNLKSFDSAFFIIIGKGTEKTLIKNELKSNPNTLVLDFVPREEYDVFLQNTDVGIVLLDPCFTIPNYPSRILAYMENSKPILAATDNVTDIRSLIESEAKCGKWNNTADIETFVNNIKWFCENKEKRKELGVNGRKFLEENFNVEKNNINLLEKIQNKI